MNSLKEFNRSLKDLEKETFIGGVLIWAFLLLFAIFGNYLFAQANDVYLPTVVQDGMIQNGSIPPVEEPPVGLGGPINPGQQTVIGTVSNLPVTLLPAGTITAGAYLDVLAHANNATLARTVRMKAGAPLVLEMAGGSVTLEITPEGSLRAYRSSGLYVWTLVIDIMYV